MMYVIWSELAGLAIRLAFRLAIVLIRK